MWSGNILGTRCFEIKYNRSQLAKSDCQGAVSAWTTSHLTVIHPILREKGFLTTHPLCMPSPDNEAHSMNCSSPVASMDGTLTSYLERLPTELKMKKVH